MHVTAQMKYFIIFRQRFDSTSTICLYQLAFGKKTFYSNYGVFYEDLTSVCLRLDYELGSGPVLKSDSCSKLVSCYTLTDPHYQPPSKLDEDESFEESEQFFKDWDLFKCKTEIVERF